MAAPAELALADRSARGRDRPGRGGRGAHALYTDVWVSMGDEAGDAQRELLAPYRLDDG